MFKSRVALTVGILLPQLFLLGCSKSDSNASNPWQNAEPHQLESGSESETKSIATHGRVYCESRSPLDCSPSVAMLVATTPPTSVSQCTAFLVAPQIAITNSHCIPADLKAAGSDCSDRIWFYFPDASGYSEARTGCAQVLAASTIPEQAKAVPDYAVIRLDQAVRRPFLEISRDGFNDGDTYQLIKINPQSKTDAVGAMTRATCKAVHNSALVPNSNDDRSANMAMGDCQIVHGNSGSPLLDSKGRVSGLIQMTVEENTLTDFYLRMSLPLLDSSIGPLGAGTSFACLQLPEAVSASPVPAQCATVAAAPDSTEIQKQILLLKAESGLTKEMSEISSELDPSFQWSVMKYEETGFHVATSDPTTVYAIPVPTCIENPKPLLEGHKKWYRDYDATAEQNVVLKKITVKMGLNRYLAPSCTVNGSDGVVSVFMTYSPADLATKGSAEFQFLEPDYLGVKKAIFTQTLSQCKK